MSKPQSGLYEFERYRLDTAKRLLTSAGQVVLLKPKTFDLLLALVESHGRVLTKDELMKMLWPDTFVEEANLSFQVSALRKAFGEERQHWIETVPKHGYRFSAPVVEVTPEPVEPREPGKPARRTLAITVASLCLAIAGAVAWLKLGDSGPVPRSELVRLTSDAGLSTDPALSPDGRLVAYASDRGNAGNLDIWVRQLSGGDPIRLTEDPAEDREPAWSPDGSHIVFHSERERGGGIYVIPALGGQPVLLARHGRRPRYSPDGNWVAYWVGSLGIGHLTGRGSGKVFVVSAKGGEPFEVQPQFAAARYPVWSPDGKWLLFAGSRDPVPNRILPELRDYQGDWFLTPVKGGPVRSTGVFSLLQKERLSPPVGEVQVAPGEWRSNGILFAAKSGDSTNLWQIPFSPSTLKVGGPPRRITFGTGLEIQPSLATVGENTAAIVFASLKATMGMWSLPLRSDRLTSPAEPVGLSEHASDDFVQSVSPDGKQLLFASNRTGKSELWMRDLSSGRDTPFFVTPGRALFSRDGKAVGHTVPGPNWPIYLTPSTGGLAEKLCDQCGTYWDWSSDRKRVIYVASGERTRFEVLDLGSGTRSRFLQDPDFDLYIPLFSPDDRWIQFMARNTPDRTWGFVVPFTPNAVIRRSDWIPVSDGESWTDAWRWSMDGNRLYFLSASDGYRCLWGQEVSPATKRPAGPPFAVYHSHRARLSLMNLTWGHGALAISKDRAVFGQGELIGNLWMTRVSER